MDTAKALNTSAEKFGYFFPQEVSRPTPAQISQFVREFYAPGINYYNKGLRSQALVLADKLHYLSNWSQRSYNVIAIPERCIPFTKFCYIDENVSFLLQGKRGIASGVAKFLIDVEFSGTTPLVTSEGGWVLNEFLRKDSYVSGANQDAVTPAAKTPL